ncbi:hypothetical protein WJU16_07935 [Chitinophaga pollutisoli]|uniref:Uncharacterized protein n=1 Tax=Chitinophaga pollutisoli TaxID=3133966 RepID=A0ABZ2YTQ3_9BACT
MFYLLTGNPYIILPAVAESLIAASALYLNHRNEHTPAALVTYLNQCFAILYFGLAPGDVLLHQLMVVLLIRRFPHFQQTPRELSGGRHPAAGIPPMKCLSLPIA